MWLNQDLASPMCRWTFLWTPGTRCLGIIDKWKSIEDRCETSKRSNFFLKSYLAWHQRINIYQVYSSRVVKFKDFAIIFFSWHICRLISTKSHFSSLSLTKRKRYHTWELQSVLHKKIFPWLYKTPECLPYHWRQRKIFPVILNVFICSVSDCTAPYNCRHLDNQAKSTFQCMC